MIVNPPKSNIRFLSDDPHRCSIISMGDEKIMGRIHNGRPSELAFLLIIQPTIRNPTYVKSPRHIAPTGLMRRLLGSGGVEFDQEDIVDVGRNLFPQPFIGGPGQVEQGSVHDFDAGRPFRQQRLHRAGRRNDFVEIGHHQAVMRRPRQQPQCQAGDDTQGPFGAGQEPVQTKAACAYQSPQVVAGHVVGHRWVAALDRLPVIQIQAAQGFEG